MSNEYFIYLRSRKTMMRDGAVVARRAHNPKVVGSSPALATTKALTQSVRAFFIYKYYESELSAIF